MILLCLLLGNLCNRHFNLVPLGQSGVEFRQVRLNVRATSQYVNSSTCMYPNFINLLANYDQYIAKLDIVWAELDN